MTDDGKCPASLFTFGLDPLDAGVVENFRRAAHLHRQVFTRVVGGDKPGHPGRAIMLLVLGGAPDGMTQRQVAERLRLSPPAVTVMLQKLEAEGVIERWTDPDDQRLTRIRMTTAGREAAASIGERYRSVIDTTVGGMPDTDRREFARLLGDFSDRLTQALSDALA